MSACEKCGNSMLSCACGTLSLSSALKIFVADKFTPERESFLVQCLVLVGAVLLSHQHTSITAGLNVAGSLVSFREARKAIKEEYQENINLINEKEEHLKIFDRARFKTAAGNGHTALFSVFLLIYLGTVFYAIWNHTPQEAYSPGDLYESTGAPIIDDVTRFKCTLPSTQNSLEMSWEISSVISIFLVNQLMPSYASLTLPDLIKNIKESEDKKLAQGGAKAPVRAGDRFDKGAGAPAGGGDPERAAERATPKMSAAVADTELEFRAEISSILEGKLASWDVSDEDSPGTGTGTGTGTGAGAGASDQSPDYVSNSETQRDISTVMIFKNHLDNIESSRTSDPRPTESPTSVSASSPVARAFSSLRNRGKPGNEPEVLSV